MESTPFNRSDWVRCPVTKERLVQATDQQLARLNDRISQGQLYDRLGRKLHHPLEDALLNRSGTLAYPVVDQIPTLMASESIPLDQPATHDRQKGQP